MNTPDAPQEPAAWLPRAPEAIFGAGATAEEAYDLLTVDVPADRWIPALEAARDELGCTYFDWLSAVDEPGTGLRVCAHVAALPGGTGAPHTAVPHTGAPHTAAPHLGVRRLLVRTTVPHETPILPTATAVYAGAAWHERETHEMFGIGFTGHPHLDPLLLPDGFEGHPLRKEFVLAARVAKAWPGAKEPGESGHGGPKRRQMLPPGVPDPNEWGPLKGQLPPAPSRSARRTRTAGGGSASRRGADAGAEAAPAGPRRPARRTRSASEGSASQRTERGTDRGTDRGGGVTPAPQDGGSASPGEASPQGATGASGPGPATPGEEQNAPGAAGPEENRAPGAGDEEPEPEGAPPVGEPEPESHRDDEGGTH